MSGKALVFHPPIRHDEASRSSEQPETDARERMRRTDLFREAPPPGTADTNDGVPRETLGGETTGLTGATSGMWAGMRASSSPPTHWFARVLGALEGMTSRTERKSQRRQILAFLDSKRCEVERPAKQRNRPRVLRQRSEKLQEQSPGDSEDLHGNPPSGRVQ